MKKKATFLEDKYSEILRSYVFAEESGVVLLDLCWGINHPYKLKTTWSIETVKIEPFAITEAIEKIESIKTKLSDLVDEDLLDQIFLGEANNPQRVLSACDSLLSLIQKVRGITGDSITHFPIKGLFIDYCDGKPDLEYCGKRFDHSTEDYVVSTQYDILRTLDAKRLSDLHCKELEIIYRTLPGILAYLNTLDRTTPKKNRNPEAIKKEKDFLYLLDQYDRWKTKTNEVTGRKRLSPKEWHKDFDSWTEKSRRIFDQWAESGNDQDDIDSIIKYAQKMKRERSERDE